MTGGRASLRPPLRGVDGQAGATLGAVVAQHRYRALLPGAAALALLCGTLAHGAGGRTRGLTVTLRASERPGAAAADRVKLYTRSSALVVGIDAYDGGWPRLRNAVRDGRVVGSLSLVGTPDGARVDLTGPGGYSKATRLPATLRSLKPGRYLATVTSPGFEGAKRSATVQVDRLVTLTVKLERLGRLRVSGTPEGAEVRVLAAARAEVAKGALPMTVRGLGSGTYEVMASRPGYYPHIALAKVLPGEETHVSLKLDRMVTMKCRKGRVKIKRGSERVPSVAATDSYCIDRYEYPGTGRVPSTHATYAQAEAVCAARNARLCTDKEWERACKGPRTYRYPYGNKFDPDRCVTEDADENPRDVQAAGSFKGCKSGYGVYDLSGNVAEWTAEGHVRGGSAQKPDYAVRCAHKVKRARAAQHPFAGFRCCSDLK